MRQYVATTEDTARNSQASKMLSSMANPLKRPQTSQNKAFKPQQNVNEKGETLGRSTSNQHFNLQSQRTIHVRPMTGIDSSRRGQSGGQHHIAFSRPQTAFVQSVIGGMSTNTGYGGNHNHHQQSLEFISQSEMPIDIRLATVRKNLATKSTISCWTKEENRMVDSTIDNLATIEKNFEKKSSFALIDRVDCKDKITKAFREIKCLNYQLTRIVQAAGDGNIDIPHRKPFDIEVMQETLMTFRLPVRLQPSPARFQVEYKEQAGGNHKHELKIFCSSNHKEPKENNCQKTFNNPTRFAIGATSKSDFTSEFIYLSFYSFTGCSLSLTVNFGDASGKEKSPNKKGKYDEDDEDIQEEDRERRRKDEDDKFEKIMRKQKQKLSAIDFVSKNMEKVSAEQLDLQKEKLFKIRTTWKRIESAKSRKSIIEEDERKKKIFLLHRWEFLKEKRREMQADRMQLQMEQIRKFELCRQITTLQMMKHIFTVFDQKRNVAVTEAKIQFAVNMFGIKFRRWSMKKRLTEELRNQQTAKQVFTFHCDAMIDVREQEAKNFMKLFLSDTSLVHSLKEKMRIYHRKMTCIQTTYRNHRTGFANRRAQFAKVNWEKEKQYLIKQCIGKKISKLKQELFKKINLCSDNIKDAIIKVYMRRCIYRFQARFLEWRLDFKMGSATDQMREIELEKLTSKKRSLEALDKLLFLGVLLPDESPPVVAPPQPTSPVKEVKKQPARGKGKVELPPPEPPKPIITPMQKIQKMMVHADEDLSMQPPIFRFMPPSKEVVQRLIIKASNAKTDKDFLSAALS